MDSVWRLPPDWSDDYSLTVDDLIETRNKMLLDFYVRIAVGRVRANLHRLVPSPTLEVIIVDGPVGVVDIPSRVKECPVKGLHVGMVYSFTEPLGTGASEPVQISLTGSGEYKFNHPTITTDRNLIQKIDSLNDTDVVSDFGSFGRVFRRDLITLLNVAEDVYSCVMDVYMSLLNDRNTRLRMSGKSTPNCFFHSLAFYRSLVDGDSASTALWSVKCRYRLWELDLLVFPVMLNNARWCIGVIDMRNYRLDWYDCTPAAVQRDDVHFHRMRDYIRSECKGIDNGWLENYVFISQVVTDPIQSVDESSGVNAIVFANYAGVGESLQYVDADLFSDTSGWRQWIASDIMRGVID